MEHKSSETRTADQGRFGKGSASTHGRPTGSFRTQPSGAHKSRSEYARTRGNSEYMPARGYTPPRHDRATEDAPQNPEVAPAKHKPKKRGLLIGLLIAIAIIIALTIALVISIAQRPPMHMLPTVTPPETAADISTGEGA